MTDGKLTVEELQAWMRVTHPAGSWNKYHKVENDRTTGTVFGYYRVSVPGTGGDIDTDFDEYTKEEFVKFCGFESRDHYKQVKHYQDNKPLRFDDLRQGMVVFSESLRHRYIIGQRKDKDSVYVNQVTVGGRFGGKRIFLGRNEVDNNFFRKSKMPVVEKESEDMSDAEHAKYSEYATD